MSVTRKQIEAVLRGLGLTDGPESYGDGIHGWRCEHPDIYGRCDCFKVAVNDLYELMKETDDGLDDSRPGTGGSS